MKTSILFFSLIILPLFSYSQEYKSIELKTSNEIRVIKKGEEISFKTISNSKHKGRISAITDSSVFLNSVEVVFHTVKWAKHIRKRQKVVATHILINGVVSGAVISAFIQSTFNDDDTWNNKADALFLCYPAANIVLGSIMMKKKTFALKRGLQITSIE